MSTLTTRLSALPRWASQRISQILDEKSIGEDANRIPANSTTVATVSPMVVNNGYQMLDNLAKVDELDIDQAEGLGAVKAEDGSTQLQGFYPAEHKEDIQAAITDFTVDLEAAGYRRDGDQETAVYLKREKGVYTVVQLERTEMQNNGTIYLEIGPLDTDGFMEM